MPDIQQTFHVFSSEDVRLALPMDQAVKAMKAAFQQLSAGEVTVPMRTHMDLSEYNGDVLVMPSYCPRLEQVGLKIITLHPDNVERGLPFIQATVMLVDAERGTPLAVMNGAALTALRTGGASGAATDILAREDACHVAIIGSGIQAATQLEAMCTVRKIRTAAVFDLDHARAASFARRMSQQLKIEVNPAGTASAALAGADIVCTATTSKTPVFDDADIEPGTHINAIGVYKINEREIPGPTVARARVVVDERAAAWQEAGELVLALKEGLITKNHVQADIGEVLSGHKPGRQSEDEITFFKSVGVGNQDLFAAHIVLARGTTLGLGTVVSL